MKMVYSKISTLPQPLHSYKRFFAHFIVDHCSHGDTQKPQKPQKLVEYQQ